MSGKAMSLLQRKADLAEARFRLAQQHARLLLVRDRFWDRPIAYNRLIADIERELAVIEARIALIEANTAKLLEKPPD
jgi:hypothetical protein